MSSNENGFTFFELLIYLAISAFLAGIAAPNLFYVLKKARVDSTAYTLQRSLSFARIYAVRNHVDTTFCGTRDQRSCVKKNFSAVMVFNDKNNNRVVDGDEVLLSSRQLKYSGTLWFRAGFGKNYTVFTRQGFAKFTASIVHCDSDNASLSRRVTVNRPGRNYKGRDTNGDGIVDDLNGKSITC